MARRKLSKAEASRSFEQYYNLLCEQQSTCPASMMRTHRARVTDQLVQICVDRLEPIDWYPLLEALRVNTRLQKVVLVSKYYGIHRTAARQQRQRHATRRNLGILPPSATNLPVIHHAAALDDLVRALSALLQNNKVLTTLQLRGLPFSYRQLQRLVPHLASHPSLLTLDFVDCKLDDEAIEALATALQASNNIMAADLSRNACGQKGARGLAQVIRAQNAKRGADAWEQSLRGRGADVSTMRGNYSLRYLSLDFNRSIGDEGAIELANALADDTWLLDAFFTAMRTNSALILLDVGNNGLPAAVRERLQQTSALNRPAVRGELDEFSANAYQQLSSHAHLLGEMAALRQHLQPTRRSTKSARRKGHRKSESKVAAEHVSPRSDQSPPPRLDKHSVEATTPLATRAPSTVRYLMRTS
ncbi:uncharacterized protein MONBRDRAFT_25464 [Monosiga brevicollis MX1]|uniref:Centrosomal protein of 78 kDa n=1 Tax=Monosiga brevicollis TaxID=81824 RepID=A9UZH8_MONBE|nr:uncharacterized protein MONBRDRAFT_25464 [Monosiga brevicollis MX1]EDQ89372.1 predicted protein [Monosiga brevicollis MX1]|eukprot:XP_001745948.1 hypothetical protein [Monosiga brevicollis MX1]